MVLVHIKKKMCFARIFEFHSHEKTIKDEEKRREGVGTNVEQIQHALNFNEIMISTKTEYKRFILWMPVGK